MRRLNPLYAALLIFASIVLPIGLSFGLGSWCFRSLMNASGCDVLGFLAIPFVVFGVFGGLILFYLSFFTRLVHRKQPALGVDNRTYALLVFARVIAAGLPLIAFLEQYAGGALFGDSIASQAFVFGVLWLAALLFLNAKNAL